MKKGLLFLFVACFLGTISYGQELIQNGDFELPDDGLKYNRIDSIPGWHTDDEEGNTGRDITVGNGVGWQWDGTGSIYQVIGTVPPTAAQFDVSLEATCNYSYWSDYITDMYVIFSAFPGTDTLARVPIDTITFTVSCFSDKWMKWESKTGTYNLEADNPHAGENLVFEIDIYNSRDFGFDESWTYLNYDNVSVVKSGEPTSVKDLKDDELKVISTPEMIRILGEKSIESAIIFDISGKRVLEARPNSSKVTLNVGHLNRGIYIVNVLMNGQKLTRKVVL